MISQVSCFFILLTFDCLIFFFFDNFNLCFQLFNMFWHMDVFKMHSCTNFIKYVYCFIWKEPVAYIPVTEFYTSSDRFIGIRNVMEFFVFGFDVVQYVFSFFSRRWFYQNFLKTPV